MNREAVLHIPMSNYAHGIDESRFVFRLRAAKNDLTSCTLYFGDTACRDNPIHFYPRKMQVVASDEYYDYYEVEFNSPFNRIYYYFELSDGKETVLYYSDFFRDSQVEERSEYYKLPYNRREDIADIPDWVKQAVIYNIFPDSFASGYRNITGIATTANYKDVVTHGKLGGTINGIAANVDYLEQLGINCIYINPIFAAGEYHKYDVIDYFTIDPCFGTNDDFRNMVKVFHEHNIKVIIDGVFNHCGWEFFAFDDVVKNGENSKYKDWFYKLTFPVVRPDNGDVIPGYECYAYERLMPKLNTSNPEVMDYLISAGKYWLEEFDIDGWRLDVASEVDDNFWREFRKATKAVKPECFLIGEVWESAGHWLDGSQFDSTMNYDLRKHCKYFFADNEIDAMQFGARVTNMVIRYKKNMLWGQLNLLDSHDVSRFLSVCNGNVDKWKLSVIFQMMFIGVPSIFYGDEQMISGDIESEFRKPMIWDSKSDMYDFYKTLISIRRSQTSIQSGQYKTIMAKENSMVFGFERFNDDECMVVLLNAGDRDESIGKELINGEILMSENFKNNIIGPYGYAIIRRKDYQKL